MTLLTLLAIALVAPLASAQEPDGAPEDPQTVEARAGCAKGDVEACWNLGPEALPRLRELLGPPCAAGDVDKCLSLAHAEYTWPPAHVDAAFALTKDACSRKSDDGCRFYAQMLLNGEGAAPDVRTAVELTRARCGKGDDEACGELYRLGVTPDQEGLGRVGRGLAKADPLLAGCVAGKGQDCTTLGGWYDEGAWNLPQLYTTASALYGRGCATGSDLGCVLLARMLSYPDVSAPVGLREALGATAQERGCLAGEGGLCQALADAAAYSYSEDPAVLAAGIPWRQRACMAGEVEACAALRAAGEPEALPGDPQVHTWRDWLGLHASACNDAANPVSCRVLFMVYRQGLFDVPADPARAMDALARTCLAGVPNLCASVGAQLQSGEGVPADPTRALALFETGCALEEGPSCFALSKAWAEGIGTKKDAKKAKKFLAQATALGFSGEPDAATPDEE